MKHKHFLFFRRPRHLDVFQQTQSKLAKGYSWQIILFLIFFIAVVYSALYTVILQTQERELRLLAEQESRVIAEYMLKNNVNWRDNPQILLAGVDQYFYYVLNAQGDILLGDEVNTNAREKILSAIDSNFGQAEIFQTTIQPGEINGMKRPHGKDDIELQLKPAKAKINLLIASSPIIYKNQVVGVLYTGKDISSVYEILKWTLIILLTLAVLFFVIAVYISNRMSKKAMVPIQQAFLRQREFVADASHELRTPLSVIHSSIEAIEMTVDIEDEFARKLVVNMKDEVKRMTRLVSDLLTLARSDSGKIELKKEQVDLKPIVEKTIHSVQALAQQKQISVKCQSPETVLGVVDLERFQQLLYILLDNAIKYTNEGGAVTISLASKQNYVMLTVKDTGVGISIEDKPFIFERFYRADKARSRQMGSFGLGLSIAKWIVDMHKGTIEVESELGKGTTFIVKIPF